MTMTLLKNKIKEIIWKFVHWFDVNSEAYNVGHTVRETYWFVERWLQKLKYGFLNIAKKAYCAAVETIQSAIRSVVVWYEYDKNVYQAKAAVRMIKKKIFIFLTYDKHVYTTKNRLRTAIRIIKVWWENDKYVFRMKLALKAWARAAAIWWECNKYVTWVRAYFRGEIVLFPRLDAWWRFDKRVNFVKNIIVNFVLWFNPNSKVTNIGHAYGVVKSKTSAIIYHTHQATIKGVDLFYENIIYKKIESSTWCPYPWFNLNSNTDGNIKLCCSITENYHITDGNRNFNFGKDPIEKIWNSQYMKDIRNDLSNSRKPKTCDTCWKLEENNLESSRMAAIRDKLHRKGKPVVDLPTSLELRLGNKCNLKCMSCWSLSSSSILAERKMAAERTDLAPWLRDSWEQEVKDVGAVNYDWFGSPAFKESFKKMAPTLKRLYLTGGEPTLIDENCEFLQMLLDAKNDGCAVSFTTNCTIWNEKFYGLISKFKSAEVQISLDGFGQMNEYVRYPSNWSQVDRNLRKIFKLPPQVNIKIFSVVSILNVMRITELVEYLLENLTNRSYIYAPIILQSPDFLSTRFLSAEYRTAAAERINDFLKSHPMEFNKIWYKFGLKAVVDHLQFGETDDIHRNYNLDLAKDYVLAHEKIRNLAHPHKRELFEKGLI